MDIEEKIHQLLKEQGIHMTMEISFPQYKNIPYEVQLALEVLRKHGMKISLLLVPQK